MRILTDLAPVQYLAIWQERPHHPCSGPIGRPRVSRNRPDVFRV